MKQLEIENSVKYYIQQHLENSFPNEGCGFFYGLEDEQGNRQVLLAEAVNNKKEGDQRRRFEISPLDYVKAEQKALELGLQLLGIYHSHPNHPAIPSQFDLDKAMPYFSYIIQSVQDGEGGELTSWRLQDEQRVFEEEQVLIHIKDENYQFALV